MIIGKEVRWEGLIDFYYLFGLVNSDLIWYIGILIISISINNLVWCWCFLLLFCRVRKIFIIIRRFFFDGSFEDWGIDEFLMIEWMDMLYCIKVFVFFLL